MPFACRAMCQLQPYAMQPPRVSFYKTQCAGAFLQPCRLLALGGPHIGELGCVCWRPAGLRRAQSPASKHAEGSLQLGKDKLTLLNILGPIPRLVRANKHLLTLIPICTKQGCCRALSKQGFCKGRKVKPKINLSLMVNPLRKPNTTPGAAVRFRECLPAAGSGAPSAPALPHLARTRRLRAGQILTDADL